MCTDAQQIVNQATGQVVEVACRVCDECIAVRRHGWVARAMAEKSMWPHTLCITLTYSDAEPEYRDAAKVFAYIDVSEWLKRLRAAATEKHGFARVRFICAGEQGDRNGRCHWHVIVYSSCDLTEVGEVSVRGVKLTARSEKMTVGKHKRRLDWSLWPAGFVTFQEPDLAGMHYVLSYCLKDQFTVEKSKRTARVAKAENFATGLFRMSKRPAIGEPFVWQWLQRLDELGAVVPRLRIKIPGFRGYWHPNGDMRKNILWGLRAINQRHKWATGHDCPQWSGLLASCEASPTDLEALIGSQEEHISLESQIDFKTRETAERQRNAHFRRRCGRTIPCHDCLSRLSDEAVSRLGLARKISADWQTLEFYVAGTGERAYGKPANRINPYCARKGSRDAILAFPSSGRET